MKGEAAARVEPITINFLAAPTTLAAELKTDPKPLLPALAIEPPIRPTPCPMPLETGEIIFCLTVKAGLRLVLGNVSGLTKLLMERRCR